MALSTALVVLTTNCVVKAADMTTDYIKPTVSSKACVDTAEEIAAQTESFGNDASCMQCDPARPVRSCDIMVAL